MSLAAAGQLGACQPALLIPDEHWALGYIAAALTGGDGACSTAVGDGHPKEGRGDGMGFDVAFLGQASDKTVKMNTVSAFNAVVAYN